MPSLLYSYTSIRLDLKFFIPTCEQITNNTFLKCFPFICIYILIRLWCKSERHESQKRELDVSVNGWKRTPGSTKTFLMPSFSSMMLVQVLYCIGIRCSRDAEEKFSRQLVPCVPIFKEV